MTIEFYDEILPAIVFRVDDRTDDAINDGCNNASMIEAVERCIQWADGRSGEWSLMLPNYRGVNYDYGYVGFKITPRPHGKSPKSIYRMKQYKELK